MSIALTLAYVIGDGAYIESGAVIGQGSYVPPKTRIPSGQVWRNEANYGAKIVIPVLVGSSREVRAHAHGS